MPCPVVSTHAPSRGHATDGGAVYDGLIPCPVWKRWVTLAGVRPFLKRTLHWLGTHGLTAHDGHWGHADEKEAGVTSHQPLRAIGKHGRGGGGTRTSLRPAPAFLLRWLGANGLAAHKRALGPRRADGGTWASRWKPGGKHGRGGSGYYDLRRLIDAIDKRESVVGRRPWDVGAGSATTGLS
ncbi:hypothetical protein C8F01DRAFT_281847 [Mycena amicta]|nr:hypothetical protein C8F01DRAFT_281847 [Mycena amicta]